MPRPVDTTTKLPWPEPWANRRLQVFRKEAIADLTARDVSRGIPANGQVYTALSDEKGGDGTERKIINVALAAVRHNYREVRKLFKARWFKFCAKPQDLDKFKTEFEKPDALALAAAQEAAAGIEESLQEAARPIEESLPAFAGTHDPSADGSASVRIPFGEDPPEE